MTMARIRIYFYLYVKAAHILVQFQPHIDAIVLQSTHLKHLGQDAEILA